jgi:hypothetical protein
MAEVTGRIGQDDVLLNNAATEATLKLLLQSTLSANKQSLTAVENLARSSGLNPQMVQAANQSLNVTAASGSKVGKVFESLGFVAGALSSTFKEAIDLGTKLASNQAQASDVFAAFAKIPGPLGVIAGLFEKLAIFQQTTLTSYQTLTNAGASFGGSLTELRLAASSTYMTLNQFTDLVAKNADAFSIMGGSVDQGVRSFVKLSNSLLASDAGSKLLALGYTTEQVNSGMANYIAITGGRTAEEMRNTKAITAASAEYLTQLDGLAQLTGKSRQQQEETLKKASQNAAYQQKLLTMDEKQKAAANRGLAEMSAKFGQSGVELYQAQVMGIPPQTEAAKNLMALSADVAKASQGMADVANRGGTAAETMKYSAEATQGAVNAAKQFEGVAGALSFRGDGASIALMTLIQASNKATQQGIANSENELQLRGRITAEQLSRQGSEARAAIETQKALTQLGQEILLAVMPIIRALLPVMNVAIKLFADMVTPVAKFIQSVTEIPGAMNYLGIAVLGLAGVFLAAKVIGLAGTIGKGVSSIMRGGSDTFKGAAEGFKKGGVKGAIAGVLSTGSGTALGGLAAGLLGSSPGNPMYVAIVKGGPGGGVLDQLTDALGSKDKGSGTGKIGDKLGGGQGGILQKITGQMGNMGKVLGMAGSVLGKVALPIAAGASAYNAYQGFTADQNASIEDKFFNAGSSALSGLTFGLLGSSPQEIAARSKKPSNEEKNNNLQQEGKPPSQSLDQSNKPSMESASTELNILNKTMNELLKYTKEMADYAKRTMEGVKEMNPNLFQR